MDWQVAAIVTVSGAALLYLASGLYSDWRRTQRFKSRGRSNRPNPPRAPQRAAPDIARSFAQAWNSVRTDKAGGHL